MKTPVIHAERQHTRDDLTALIAAVDHRTDFEKFVLDRFAAYTRSASRPAYFQSRNDPNGKHLTLVEPIFDPQERTNSGYGYWRIDPNWVLMLRAIVDDDDACINVEHYVAEDRGRGSVDGVVKVPLWFIFNDARSDETDDDYATYLTLKARFEPSSPQVAPAPPRGAIDALVGKFSDRQERSRREAARVLWLQSERRTGSSEADWEHLADPANKDLASEAYRKAMSSLVGRSGLKDVRRQVHDAARVLGAELQQPPQSDPHTDQERATTSLGFTLLDAITDGLLKVAPVISDEETARIAYQKSRAALVLGGKDLFGSHTDQVVSVIDDVARLLGLRES